MDTPLAGKRVWLTRPSHQATAWAQVLESAGARVLCEPLLQIEWPQDIEMARQGLERAEHADHVIATSTNAISAAWRLRPTFAPTGALYGVGAASAAALAAACGRGVAQPAAGFSSEQLLALPALNDLRDCSVALLAGEGGRDLLVQTLGERGAQVEKIALYRRRPVSIPEARLRALIAASDAVIVTSGEALAQLATLARGDLREALARRLLVAPSVRVVKQAQQHLNWTQAPVAVARMSGDAVVAALAQVWQGTRE